MSDKPVAERLQVKRDRRLALVAAPPGLDAAIGVPDARASVEDAEVVVLFAVHRAALVGALPALLPRLRADAILWIAYPKLSSSRAADLSRDTIHAAMPAYGLDTVSQIALDVDWSAMRMKRV